MAKVKKYTITIFCEDDNEAMTINGIYLGRNAVKKIFMYLIDLWGNQIMIRDLNNYNPHEFTSIVGRRLKRKRKQMLKYILNMI